MKYTPLAEITLRKYEKPFRLTGRELTKKLCLSLGLLQPGDNRDSIVDVLHTVVHAREPITSRDIEHNVLALRKQHELPLKGIAGSNIRRQLKRLKDYQLIEQHEHKYHLTEHERLPDIFSDKIEKLYLPSIISRIHEYLQTLEEERWNDGRIQMSKMQK